MKTQKFTIDPHPDVELGLPRRQIDCFVCIPDEVTSRTGLLLTVPGWGRRADDEYFLTKLNPRICQKYGCIVASANYHWIVRRGNSSIPDAGAFLALADGLYGTQLSTLSDPQAALESLLERLEAQGVRWLPQDFKNLIEYRPKTDYASFGFLPALDQLTMLQALLDRFDVDRSKLMIYGSSYGGYIAHLASKFAPNTFSVVIESSGFCRTLLDEVLAAHLHGKYSTAVVMRSSAGGFTIKAPAALTNPWSMDETSPNYFSDAHRRIRSLIAAPYFPASHTRHYVFHGTEDFLVPISEKDQFVAALEKVRRVYYKRVAAEDVDGRLFKHIQHGMSSSLTGLFDFTMDHLATQDPLPTDTAIDFNSGKEVSFPCGLMTYKFIYPRHAPYRVEVERVDPIAEASPLAD